MRTAIELAWWVGLVGALVPTLVILKLAFLVVGRLREILKLAALTNVAARGVAANVAAVDALRGVGAHRAGPGIVRRRDEAAARDRRGARRERGSVTCRT